MQRLKSTILIMDKVEKIIILFQIEEDMGNENQKGQSNGSGSTGNYSDGNSDYYILEDIAKISLNTNASNILFMIEDDTTILNKYRLNYRCLTKDISPTKAKTDFIKLANKLYPSEKNNIQNFKNSYQTDLSMDQKGTQALKWCFMNNFYLDSIQAVAKSTTDPKVLAYLRLPVRDIQEGIIKKFKTQQKNIHEMYMVLSLNKIEEERFTQNCDNFISFPSFMKGYTNQKKAKEESKKIKNSFLCRIMLPKNKKDEALDFGYYIEKGVENGPNVLFNIYNFFKVDEFIPEEKQIVLVYAALAELSFKRNNQRFDKLSDQEKNMIRNFDYIEDLTKQVKDQAKILQISGNLRDSLIVQSQKMQQIRKSQSPAEIQIQNIQLGDAYRLNEEYAKAETQYKKVQSKELKTVALVHLAELYLKMKNDEKLSPLIPQIESGLSIMESYSKVQVFKARNLIGLSLMSKERFKEAHKCFQSLIGDATEYYEFRFEGIPLVHEIYNNMATCKTKLNQYSEALGLLDSTKSWQKGCEGSRSPNLLVTQSLIKSVYEFKGEKLQVKKAEEEITKIKQSVPVGEIKYLKNSMVYIPESLEQSMVNIEMSGKGNNVGNIEQSAVNINI